MQNYNQQYSSHTTISPNYNLNETKQSHLSKDQEYNLATAWINNNDRKAFDKLVVSHLDLVHGFAYKMRGYGLNHEELVSEGIIGLINAAEKFDPEMGFRFSTYAIWHVRAKIQKFILNNWSIVKTGTTGNQRKLFFNLRRVKAALLLSEKKENKINNYNSIIAEQLGVSEKEVHEMEQRMVVNDISLETIISSDDSSTLTLKDLIPAPGINPAAKIEANLDKIKQLNEMYSAINSLPIREKYIIKKRHLTEKAVTLVKIAKSLDISHERVRQIEKKAILMLRNIMQISFIKTSPNGRTLN